jgi:hypothetical protein
VRPREHRLDVESQGQLDRFTRRTRRRDDDDSAGRWFRGDECLAVGRKRPVSGGSQSLARVTVIARTTQRGSPSGDTPVLKANAGGPASWPGSCPLARAD